MKEQVPEEKSAWWEAALILVPCAALLYVFIHFSAFDLFYEYSRAHENLELDEFAAVLVVAAIASLILLRRRARVLKREIQRRERAEERERKLARHDALTGLGNRRVLGEVLSAWEENQDGGALLLIDLDKFKPVNDLHGHGAGDQVLREVANRLRNRSPQPELIYRLGGDEFVVLLPELEAEQEISAVASGLISSLSEPYEIANSLIEIGASIGIARCPANTCEQSQLLRAADIAMYEAKRGGARRFSFFVSRMDEELRQHAELEVALRRAIREGEIKPYFQPVVHLQTGALAGFEALARWEHPERGTLPPSLFIPMAEDLGLIGELSEEILRKSCLAARNWPVNTTLAVNIAPCQFLDSWFAIRLLGILSETGFPPHRLIVEVTESAVLDNTEASRRTFASLRNAGIRVALDDFGKGYSSVSHLHQFDFDHLKIDSSFVMDMAEESGTRIVNAITALGKSLHMPIVAEGVETAVNADALTYLGCEHAQGFLFGRPVNEEDTLRFIGELATKGLLRRQESPDHEDTHRSSTIRALP